MTIRPVDLNGMIQRTDDVAQIKHHEDNKPVLQQQNIQVQVDKREENLSHQVSDANQSEKTNSESENGANQYYGDGGMFRKKKKKPAEDGKVIKKNSVGSFDVKI